MSDAERGPADQESSSHRYLFPKALAKFFIPLPDPLPIRDGYFYLWSFPIWPWDVEKRRAAGAVEVDEHWLHKLLEQASAFSIDENLREPEPDADNQFEQRTDPNGPRAELSAFGTSIRLWMGTAGGVPFPAVKHLADTAKRSEALNNGLSDLNEDELSSHYSQGMDYTVAEIVVPLDSEPEEDAEAAAMRSFDCAISALQNLQESLYQVRRYPFREVTKEQCPPFVPFQIADVTSNETNNDFPVETWNRRSMILRMNPWEWGRPTMLDSNEYEQLDEALWNRLKDRPFASSLELRRSATVALERTGDYRASVIWSASQAEALLDELLRHLMWEEGRIPERCLAEFQTLSISARVRTHYESRLGGTWDLVTPGPVTDWKVKVADLRNQIVHEHFQPSWTDASEAILAVDALISHVGDLLALKLKHYFRTAMQLLATGGLQKRGVLEEFEQHAANSYPLDWTHTYGEWRHTHKALLGKERTLNEDRSDLLFVFGKRNRGYWVLVDPQTRLAARVLVDEKTFMPTALANIISLLDAPQEDYEGQAISMRMAAEPAVVKLIDKPREQYHLVPMYGVRVNGDDIADREFIWRPKAAPRPSGKRPPAQGKTSE